MLRAALPFLCRSSRGAPALLLCLAACADKQPAVDLSDWPVGEAQPGTSARFDGTVLVTIDTLRADHVSSYGYPRQTTPFLDSLASRGVRFEHVNAAISHTAPSHSTMLTGLVPAVHGVLKNGEVLDPAALDMAHLHVESGFETAAFLNAQFLEGVAGSFDHVEVKSAGYATPYSGADVVDDAVAWIEDPERSGHFFLWVHLYDPHEWKRDGYVEREGAALWNGATPAGFTDYVLALHGMEPRDPGQPYRVDWGEDAELRDELAKHMSTPGDGLEAWLRCIDAYDSLTHFADAQVERLYGVVRERFPDASVLWIVTSDHGEGLGSHGTMGHGSALYQEQLAVPLVMHASDDSLAPLVVTTPVGHIDLLPTVAEALGRPVAGDPRVYHGRSLWPLIEGHDLDWSERPFFAQRRPPEGEAETGWAAMVALQAGGKKLILDGETGREFYDLAADGTESVDLGTDRPDADKLRELLKQRLIMYRTIAGHRLAEEAVVDDWRDELRALGYTD